MKQKRKGTITLICGIVVVLSAVAIIAVALIFGTDISDSGEPINIPMNILWGILGVYFCYTGIKMRKNDD